MKQLRALLQKQLRLRRRRLAKTINPADWGPIIGRDAELWESARQQRGGPKVLIATSVGGHRIGATCESLLAVALTLRGAETHVWLCDTVLPACFESNVTWYPNLRTFARHGPSRDLCSFCFAPGLRIFEQLGIPVHRYSDFLSTNDRQTAAASAATVPLGDLLSYRFDDLALGEHALAGALRFYGRASIDSESYKEAVLRRYLRAAILTALATRRLLATHRFHSAVFHHGLYVPHGPIGEVCRQVGVPVVNWGAMYRQRCLIFSHDDTYHRTLMTEPTSVWERLRWTPSMEAQVVDYLRSRWFGTLDWIRLHENPNTDLQRISRECGVDFSKPCVGLLTNVMWEAQVHYPGNAFPSMLDWVIATIRYFARRPDLQLVIRVHPSELGRIIPSGQPIAREIQKVFATLPANVFVIPPESRISTYAVMEQCNAVLIYGTKTGVELAATGIPVIVAGEAWVRNKGITHDAKTEGEYLALLHRLPFSGRLDEVTTERARKYAYHFFFRRMIPLEGLERPAPGAAVRICVNRLQELLPGHSRGLDVICSGILNQTPFVFPAESLECPGSAEM